MNQCELKLLRETHKLTQRALAEMLGYNANYISRLERGDETITPRFAKMVRTILGTKKIKK